MVLNRAKMKWIVLVGVNFIVKHFQALCMASWKIMLVYPNSQKFSIFYTSKDVCE